MVPSRDLRKMLQNSYSIRNHVLTKQTCQESWKVPLTSNLNTYITGIYWGKKGQLKPDVNRTFP